MATRFYLTNDSTAPDVSPTISATDWGHINTARRKLLTAADSSALATTAYTPDAADHLVAGNAHHCQFVSDPLRAQTITAASTVQAQLQTLEAHVNNNLALTLKVYTVDSGGTFKSALLAIVGKGTEPTTSLRNTSFAATALNGSGGDVTVADGDRLVVEIGLGGTPVVTSGVQGHNGSIRWGGTASSGDLPVDETQAATTYRPWVEFSANLSFAKIFTATDALGSYNDSYRQGWGFNFADDLGGYADWLGYPRQGWGDTAVTAGTGAGSAITVTPGAEALGSYSDTLAAGIPRQGWGDQLATFIPGVAPIAVNLPADNFAAYADNTIAAGALIVSISDAQGIHADQTAIVETLIAALAADSLGLYGDQAPTIRENLLTNPAADSLVGYADTLTMGSSGAFIITLSDSLGLYGDQAPIFRQDFFTRPTDSLAAYADIISGFFTMAARPSGDDLNQWADIAAGLRAHIIGPSADAFNTWADTFDNRHGKIAALSDAMTQADQLTGAAAKSAQLSDALPGYADQILISQGGQKLAQLSDALPNWSDQIATSGGVRIGWADSMTASGGVQRQGWTDALAFSTQAAGARTVNLSDARPAFTDTVAERYGYQHGFVLYLVDENGNYIVDENGNRFLISGLIDNMAPGDSVAVTRTTAGSTPRLVSISDGLAGFADTVQVSRLIVTLQISLADDLINYSDLLQPIAALVFSASDGVGGYNDSSPALSTSGEERVSQSDSIPLYEDSIQIARLTFIDLAFSLTDDLGGYADAAAINTSGGLLTSAGDTLAGYNDTSSVERIGNLTAALSDGLAFADALTIGATAQAGDNLAGYGDNLTHARGLLYTTPTDGLANYLDLITAGGTGQIQAALSDNLGQYQDGPPATFANVKAQPPADALIFADSSQRVLAVGYALSDTALALDDLLDVREGLFNELRFELTDTSLNQWADAAAFSRVFLAIKLSGKVIEQIGLSGKLITEKIDLTGQVYTGDP